MAVVTSDFLAALFTNYNIVWETAFAAATSKIQFEKFCTVINSETDTESYDWLGTVPQMQQWIDERQIQGLYAFNYSLQNLKYEVTIGVDRATLEDDKYNTIRPRVAQLGMEAARFPAKQATTTVVAGTSSAGYDGANFFSTTHVEGVNGNQSNSLTGSGTTLAEFRTDFLAARVAMRRFKDDQGRPMNLMPDLIHIPPDLQDVAEQLINSNLIANPTTAAPSNVLMGAAEIMVDANLTETDDWYLYCTSEILKPVFYQIRVAPQFESVDSPTDQRVFMTDQFYYGVRARFAFGYALWATAVKTTN